MKIIVILLLILSTPAFALIENQNIVNQDIENEILKNVNVISSNLINTDISDSSIVDSKIENSNLVNVDIDNTGLVDVSLDKAKIKNSVFANASVVSSTIARSKASNSLIVDSLIDSSAMADAHFKNSNVINTDILGRSSFDTASICNEDACENRLYNTSQDTIEKPIQKSREKPDITKEEPKITVKDKQEKPSLEVLEAGEDLGLVREKRERNIAAIFIEDKINNIFLNMSRFINSLTKVI